MDTRPTVSIIKACDLAGVTRRTIYNWLKAGKLEYTRTAGGSVRIYSETLFRPAGPRLAGASVAPHVSNGLSDGRSLADERTAAPASSSGGQS
jgi:excisionase family DNA binding protein